MKNYGSGWNEKIKAILRILKEEGTSGALLRGTLLLEKNVSWKKPCNLCYSQEIMIRKIRIQDYEKINFIKYKKPKISIIIPAYNGFLYTYYCLKSIKKNCADIPYEIIVADDNSTDFTKNLGKIVKGITLLRNVENLGFLLNCNHAANFAKGEYIIFLNNDVQVQKKWLSELLSLLELDRTIGMAGSKMIYPDGCLLEAGGIVWKDAFVMQVGKGFNPSCARFNQKKEVDYVSGASIIVRKDLWDKIGGFDKRFQPAYYEDVDLAFEVRKLGYKVVYQPTSVLIHYEGKSISSNREQKNKLKINRRKFLDKWHVVLEQRHYERIDYIWSILVLSKFSIRLFPDNSIRGKILQKISKLNSGLKSRFKDIKHENALIPERISLLSVDKLDDSFRGPFFTLDEEPLVTIIVYVDEREGSTFSCVQALQNYTKDTPYEILIVGNDVSEKINQVLGTFNNIRIIQVESALGYLLCCNYASQYANGKYLILIDNDTQVQGGWLKPLVNLVEKQEHVGLVGMKLIGETGFLEMAGGIVGNKGNALKYGNLCSPSAAEYQYVKEVDYTSEIAMMIKTELWKDIKGFDTQFSLGVFAAMDLAFRVRQQGYYVILQPQSVAVHLYKKLSQIQDDEVKLAVEQKMFYRKWKFSLMETYSRGRTLFEARDRSDYKKHILLIDHHVPSYDRDAGGKCTFMYLRLFAEMGMQVTFLGDDFLKREPYATELNQMGIEVLYGNDYRNNWKLWIRKYGKLLDYVYLQRPDVSNKYIDFIKENTKAKIIYFAIDLHYLREFREYKLTRNIIHLYSSIKYKKMEYKLFEKADVIHVVGSYEQRLVQKTFSVKRICNIPLYIYDSVLTNINKDFSERKDLIFVGGFGHPPNVDAVLWFEKYVFRRILKEIPELKWHIVGSNPTEDIKRLASKNIIVEGFLDDGRLASLYCSCRLAIVPLRFGAGVKGKVVEAAYYQIPLVTTHIGAEGISTKEEAFVIADCDGRMANVIIKLYNDFEKLKELSDNASRLIMNHYTSRAAIRILEKDIDAKPRVKYNRIQ